MVRDENFIAIQGWMRTKLNLKGNELLVYAIIYGFSQTENQRFTGSLQYLADWCGATKQGVLKNLKSLVDKGLLGKEEKLSNGVKLVDYYTTPLNGVLNSVEYPLNSVEYPIKHSLIHNIEDSKKENKEEYNNMISDFQFGKTKKKPKKDSLYTKCVSLIDKYDFANTGNVRKLLIEYLNYRLSVKDKPLYANMWKGILNKLSELGGNDILLIEDIIKQSIERGYLSFYPVKDFANQSKPWEEGVKSTYYTDAELEELAELDRERREKGLRTTF